MFDSVAYSSSSLYRCCWLKETARRSVALFPSFLPSSLPSLASLYAHSLSGRAECFIRDTDISVTYVRNSHKLLLCYNQSSRSLWASEFNVTYELN